MEVWFNEETYTTMAIQAVVGATVLSGHQNACCTNRNYMYVQYSPTSLMLVLYDLLTTFLLQISYESQ